MKFIENESRNVLINVAQITSIHIDKPQYEAKDYRVIANVLMSGSYVLFHGTKVDCEWFMSNLGQDLNAKYFMEQL